MCGNKMLRQKGSGTTGDQLKVKCSFIPWRLRENIQSVN